VERRSRATSAAVTAVESSRKDPAHSQVTLEEAVQARVMGWRLPQPTTSAASRPRADFGPLAVRQT